MSVQSYVRGKNGAAPAEESALDGRGLIAPFDWGVGFALSHIAALFGFALVPAVIKVGLRYLEFFQPLSLRLSFLIAAIDIGTKTWLLVAIMLLSIVVFQGGRYSVISLAQKALLAMPKVLMSSIALLMIVGAFFLAPWMYLFVLFLMWAPFFCAAEICAKSYRGEEDENTELDEEIVRPEVRLRTRTIRIFADKPIWDLGFSRSIQFTANRNNFVVSVQLALLLLVALTLPLATVVAFAGFYHSFGWIVFESFFSYAVHSLILGIACATFLKLLPREVFEEIGITVDALPVLPVRRRLRLHGKIFPFFLIALLGGLATKATVDYIVVNNSKPSTVKINFEKMERTKQQFIFHIRLEDSKNLFRWLNPINFRLELLPLEGPKRPAVEGPAIKTEAAAQPEKPELKLIEPERVMPFSVDGKALPEENFVPSNEPLRLVLYYPSALEEGQTKGKYVLYYLPLLGDPEPFLEGKFGEEDGR